jgi:hypothetical protein
MSPLFSDLGRLYCGVIPRLFGSIAVVMCPSIVLRRAAPRRKVGGRSPAGASAEAAMSGRTGNGAARNDLRLLRRWRRSNSLIRQGDRDAVMGGVEKIPVLSTSR